MVLFDCIVGSIILFLHVCFGQQLSLIINDRLSLCLKFAFANGEEFNVHPKQPKKENQV